jgi:PAS domain S-box-containing protein
VRHSQGADGAPEGRDSQDEITSSRASLQAVPEHLRADPIPDTALDAVITIDAHGVVVGLNRAARRLLGGGRSQAVGRPGLELLPEELRTARFERLWRLVSSEPLGILSGKVELSAVRADGSEFPVELVFSRTDDSPPRFTAWIRDLSLERSTAEELARRRAQLELAEQAAQSGSWERNTETLELRWSDNLFRLFGVEPRGISPTVEFVLDRTHPDDRAVVERAAALSLKRGHLEPVRYRIVRPDGAVRDLRASFPPAGDSSGFAGHRVGLVQDVTEPLRGSRAIAAHEDLAQLLVGRRDELQRPRLTPRELEVLRLAAQGQSGPEIAARLFVSPATIKTHFENLYAKLGVCDRASAVAKALRLGLMT